MMNAQRMTGFEYLDDNTCYFDSACQTLRPKPVIDALTKYYLKYNSCGERVKYAWGKRVDEEVSQSRDAVLELLKLKSKHYFVSFTLNTTYGLNLLLSQLNLPINRVITTEIEHNSVFLSTINFAKKHQIERVVLPREEDGSIDLDNDFSKSLVVVNAVSNIDGRRLENLPSLIKKVKKQGGFIIIDAAQALSSDFEFLQKLPVDGLVSSGHKMYSASLGIMVVRKDLTKYIESSFVGGGMVSSVDRDSYQLIGEENYHSLFEPGLQAWGEIISLKTAINWSVKAKKQSKIKQYSQDIFNFLSSQADVVLINSQASPVISFYHKKIDSHLIAGALSREGIMVRSGYFCCHYYLKEVKQLPHLVRISIGLHNNQQDVEKLKQVLGRIFE